MTIKTESLARAARIERAATLLNSPELNMLRAARELDDQLIRLSQIASLADVSSEELSRLGGSPQVERTDAVLTAMTIMVRDVQARLTDLNERMLNASDV